MAKRNFDNDDDDGFSSGASGKAAPHVFKAEHPPVRSKGGNFTFSDKEFYTRVLDAACTFVSVKRAAKLFFMTDTEFDARCQKVFHGMSAHDVFDYCANKADIEFRKRIQELAQDGNKSAIDIWTKYVDKIQKEEANDALRIAIVTLPNATQIAKGEDVDLNDDGGVHLDEEDK